MLYCIINSSGVQLYCYDYAITGVQTLCNYRLYCISLSADAVSPVCTAIHVAESAF